MRQLDTRKNVISGTEGVSMNPLGPMYSDKTKHKRVVIMVVWCERAAHARSAS